jgi:hypothetical protein
LTKYKHRWKRAVEIIKEERELKRRSELEVEENDP